MWTKTYSNIYKNVTKEAVWQAWADVTHWPSWDDELDYCQMTGDFVVGNHFILKPKNGPKVKIILSDVIPNVKFTDYTKFPGAIMHDAHELEEITDGIKITSIITVTGPLAFLWIKLVAKSVANSVPQQMDNLVKFVSKQHG